MEVKLKKRTPEESREYLMLQIAKLIGDRRELLETSKAVAKWLENYAPIWFTEEGDAELEAKGEDFRTVSDKWYKCIQRIETGIVSDL